MDRRRSPRVRRDADRKDGSNQDSTWKTTGPSDRSEGKNVRPPTVTLRLYRVRQARVRMGLSRQTSYFVAWRRFGDLAGVGSGVFVEDRSGSEGEATKVTLGSEGGALLLQSPGVRLRCFA